MNILVTGNGFIGKALTKRLKELGYNVRTVDKRWGADYKFDISVYNNFQQLRFGKHTDDLARKLCS